MRLLDSFRFLAIMAVMSVHLTIRWATPFYPVDVYPYGHFFSRLFAYGGMGVHFFFIISGFVIAYTLERTSDPMVFLVNRFIRLFPPILLCTFVTFVVGATLDTRHYFPFSYDMHNLLPSLTFTNPALWSAIFHRPFGYISASYWSLWVEVQFYLLAAAVYFSRPAAFLRNLLLTAVALMLLMQLPLPSYLRTMASVFNLPAYIGWFSIGAFFHDLFRQPCPDGGPEYCRTIRRTDRWMNLSAITLIVFGLFYPLDTIGRTIFLVMLGLFGVLVTAPQKLRWMENRFFVRLGLLSYTAYLIHDSSGALLIGKYGVFLGEWSPVSVPVIMALVFLFAEISFRLYEKRTTVFLKRQLLSPRRPQRFAAAPGLT